MTYWKGYPWTLGYSIAFFKGPGASWHAKPPITWFVLCLYAKIVVKTGNA